MKLFLFYYYTFCGSALAQIMHSFVSEIAIILGGSLTVVMISSSNNQEPIIHFWQTTHIAVEYGKSVFVFGVLEERP